MCGLCGSKHAPGEPHRAKQASSFNTRAAKAGITRVGGGFLQMKSETHRGSNFGLKKNSTLKHSEKAVARS